VACGMSVCCDLGNETRISIFVILASKTFSPVSYSELDGPAEKARSARADSVGFEDVSRACALLSFSLWLLRGSKNVHSGAAILGFITTSIVREQPCPGITRWAHRVDEVGAV